MTADTLAAPTTTPAATDDLCHVICDVCDRPICGSPSRGDEPLHDYGPVCYRPECAVCGDFEFGPCAHCGAP